jgi:hypothetical protein
MSAGVATPEHTRCRRCSSDPVQIPNATWPVGLPPPVGHPIEVPDSHALANGKASRDPLLAPLEIARLPFSHPIIAMEGHQVCEQFHLRDSSARHRTPISLVWRLMFTRAGALHEQTFASVRARFDRSLLAWTSGS